MKFARVISAFWGFVLVPPTCGALAAACGSDPVGIEACRSIETARCEATTACGVSETESEYCVAFYRDQCLHGIANAQAEPSVDATNACVETLRNVAECARTGAMSMSACPTITLVTDTDPALKPCDIVMRTPQVLAACAFLRTKADEVSSSSSSSSSSSGDVMDAGDGG